MACHEINISLILCLEKDEYQQRLETVFAEVRCQVTVPTVMVTDESYLSKD